MESQPVFARENSNKKSMDKSNQLLFGTSNDMFRDGNGTR